MGKSRNMITLKDKLSHLSLKQASKLLGPQGEKLIIKGGKWDVDLENQVVLKRDLFHLELGEAGVTIRLDAARDQRIDISCSTCNTSCEHQGAALSLILEEKMALGLATPPPEKVPVESLSDAELLSQAISERAERARNEKMRLTSLDKTCLWTDYIITNSSSGKSYRIALRGWERGESFCSCPDYKKNTLGTCKHIIYALGRVKTRFNHAIRQTTYQPREICVYLKYGERLELRLLCPDNLERQVAKLVRPIQELSLIHI